MKKTIAILLLSIQLYNLGGYMAVFQYFIYKADKFSEQQISKNRYKVADLVEVKIPVHLPGMSSWGSYQPIKGSVQLQQGRYNYVRMKITQDTLYVMCVPNYKTTRLAAANVIFARQVSDAPLNNKKQNIPLKGFEWLQYLPSSIINNSEPVSVAIKPVVNSYKPKVAEHHYGVLGQPPETGLC